MIAKYILFAIVALTADILAVMLAPLAACFYYVKDGREYLHQAWAWTTTHDAPVDSGHIDGYWTTKGYWSRVRWIWRNPAYQVSHWLGYDQREAVITKHKDNAETWDTGVPNVAYWTAVNVNDQKAFLYERQWYFYRNRCVEMQFGWKLYRKDLDLKCMLALRFSPFKKYGEK